MHLSSSNLAQHDAVHGIQEMLCSRQLLFWLEALSLQDSLMQYSPALAVCSSVFQVSVRIVLNVYTRLMPMQGHSDLVAAVNDAHRFVAAFSEAMESVPHIYLSSLFWLP